MASSPLTPLSAQAAALPRVSVVTISFNAEHIIRKTLESVLDQDYPNLEYLIIDGGSRDATPRIIEEYATQHKRRERIAWWVSERDSGVTEAFNKGITRHTGEYIGFLNAGDYFYSNHALSELFQNILQKTEAAPDLVYGKARLTFDPPANGHPEMIVGLPHRPAHKLPTAHQAMFYSRRMWEQYGVFSMEYRYSMDYEHYLRFRGDARVRYAFADVIVAERPLTLARNSFGNPSRTYREYLKADRAHGNTLGWLLNAAKFLRDRIKERLRERQRKQQ